MQGYEGVHIEMEERKGSEKDNVLYQRTKRYSYNTNHTISVPSGYKAEVYIKYAGVDKIENACTRKNLSKAIKKSGASFYDRDFYVIFVSSNKYPQRSWGIGNLKVNGRDGQYQVGASGNFDITITDHNRYINSFGENAVGVYTVDSITEHITGVIKKAVEPLIVKLFEEVGTLVVSTDFLLEEADTRLRERLVDKELEELQGITIRSINITALLIREEDIQNARKAANASSKASSAKRSAAARTRKKTAVKVGGLTVDAEPMTERKEGSAG